MSGNKKPSNADDPFYSLTGANHGQNIRHLQYRFAFIDAFRNEPIIRESFLEWVTVSDLPKTAQPLSDAVRQAATRHLLKRTLGIQLAYRDTFHLDLPWLAFALGDAWWKLYVASVTGREWTCEVSYLPHLAEGINLNLRDDTKKEWARMRREGKAALKQAQLPRGSIPSDNATARRDAQWLVRSTIGGIPIRQLAKEHSADGNADAHAVVQQGIRRAKKYLSLSIMPT